MVRCKQRYWKSNRLRRRNRYTTQKYITHLRYMPRTTTHNKYFYILSLFWQNLIWTEMCDFTKSWWNISSSAKQHICTSILCVLESFTLTTYKLYYIALRMNNLSSMVIHSTSYMYLISIQIHHGINHSHFLLHLWKDCTVQDELAI